MAVEAHSKGVIIRGPRLLPIIGVDTPKGLQVRTSTLQPLHSFYRMRLTTSTQHLVAEQAPLNGLGKTPVQDERLMMALRLNLSLNLGTNILFMVTILLTLVLKTFVMFYFLWSTKGPPRASPTLLTKILTSNPLVASQTLPFRLQSLSQKSAQTIFTSIYFRLFFIQIKAFCILTWFLPTSTRLNLSLANSQAKASPIPQVNPEITTQEFCPYLRRKLYRSKVVYPKACSNSHLTWQAPRQDKKPRQEIPTRYKTLSTFLFIVDQNIQ